MLSVSVVFFKQKTAYEMRISDWSSDVCSSDLQFRLPVESGLLAVGAHAVGVRVLPGEEARPVRQAQRVGDEAKVEAQAFVGDAVEVRRLQDRVAVGAHRRLVVVVGHDEDRSEEHTSELQSLMRISYAVFCLKKKKTQRKT